MSDDDKRKEAFAALEVAIEKIVALGEEDQVVAVDALLLIGMQYIDDDGDRNGYIKIVPRHGWQPGYISAGLLAMAKVGVEAPAHIADTSSDD